MTTLPFSFQITKDKILDIEEEQWDF